MKEKYVDAAVGIFGVLGQSNDANLFYVVDTVDGRYDRDVFVGMPAVVATEICRLQGEFRKSLYELLRHHSPTHNQTAENYLMAFQESCTYAGEVNKDWNVMFLAALQARGLTISSTVPEGEDARYPGGQPYEAPGQHYHSQWPHWPAHAVVVWM